MRTAGSRAIGVSMVVVGMLLPAQMASATTGARALPEASPPLAHGTYVDVTGSRGLAVMPEEVTDTGLIVGCYQKGNRRERGFTEQGSTFTTLTHKSSGRASLATCALGVNDAGVIVGSYTNTAHAAAHGFVYKHGTFRTLDAPRAGRKAGQGTVAIDINDTGVIVGLFVDGKEHEHGFIMRDGRFRTVDAPRATGGTVLDGIADNGTITGIYTTGTERTHGFWLRRGVFHRVSVPGGRNTSVACISKRSGLIVGTYLVPGRRKTFGFSDQHGVFRTLRDPSATSGTIPQCGNDSGVVVGFYFGAGGTAGFEFTPAATAAGVAPRGRPGPSGQMPWQGVPPVRTGLRPAT
jgi:hypothetical protein